MWDVELKCSKNPQSRSRKQQGLSGLGRREKVEGGGCFGFSPGCHVSHVMSWGWQWKRGSLKQLGEAPSGGGQDPRLPLRHPSRWQGSLPVRLGVVKVPVQQPLLRAETHPRKEKQQRTKLHSSSEFSLLAHVLGH